MDRARGCGCEISAASLGYETGWEVKRLKRALLTAVGVVSVGLGVLGIFLPLLPTTPFLLLAAFCFARSSPRFHDWLVGHRLLGKYIRDYRAGNLRRDAVWKTIAVLWLTLAASVLIVRPPAVVWVVLAAVGIGVSAHLLVMSGGRPRTSGAQGCDATAQGEPGQPRRVEGARPQ